MKSKSLINTEFKADTFSLRPAHFLKTKALHPFPEKMTPEQSEQRKNLIRLFTEFNKITGKIQQEISRVLVEDEKVKADLKKQLKGSENDMEIVMNNAAYFFIKVMPLASMNGCNMFGKVLALHSNLTGDPTMHEVFDAVNQQVYDEMD